ncbi:CehA/McbA family metallohydrolase [Faecalicoccus acidiformans]|uniref:CehA/McbA family metallohydrolase n=1 Tax=Faecalicoccus acidiformans TaxID=915173 RepID=UPI0025A4AFD9|nr:CehA/McbA family metallohydrolase [Faecalicoccus acidiformans]MDM8203573.1 CehA/McbA family metallohydrolase [Faecalicoccus acidiformans]
MFIRAECHNHTVHSDGFLTVEQLAAYADEHKFQVLALTDHNTASGHAEMENFISKKYPSLSLIKGIEMTTYYGHVLGLGMTKMIDFSNLDPSRPESLFRDMRQAGARAIGLAHPFCVGAPIMVGCRFDMQVNDWTQIDYIEVYNTSAQSQDPMVPDDAFFTGNEQAVNLWKEKVFQGYRLAAVTGKDIHQKPKELPVFVTYCEVDPEDTRPLGEQVISAILAQKTMVTKGPLIILEQKDLQVHVHFEKSGYQKWDRLLEGTYMLRISENTGNIRNQEVQLKNHYTFEFSQGIRSAVFELFDQNERIAIARPLYWR